MDLIWYTNGTHVGLHATATLSRFSTASIHLIYKEAAWATACAQDAFVIQGNSAAIVTEATK